MIKTSDKIPTLKCRANKDIIDELVTNIENLYEGLYEIYDLIQLGEFGGSVSYAEHYNDFFLNVDSNKIAIKNCKLTFVSEIGSFDICIKKDDTIGGNVYAPIYMFAPTEHTPLTRASIDFDKDRDNNNDEGNIKILLQSNDGNAYTYDIKSTGIVTFECFITKLSD